MIRHEKSIGLNTYTYRTDYKDGKLLFEMYSSSTKVFDRIESAEEKLIDFPTPMEHETCGTITEKIVWFEIFPAPINRKFKLSQKKIKRNLREENLKLRKQVAELQEMIIQIRETVVQ